MDGSDPPGGDSGPLLMAIGGTGIELARGLKEELSTRMLLLDTDRRSGNRARGRDFRLLGADIVAGEGCGGNLNLARACFLKEMDMLASIFLGRSPVILLSSSAGATGLAGSAEIGGLLVRTDRPSLSVLVRGVIEQSISDDRHLTSLLLDGPLRPGCLVSLNPSSGQAGPLEEVRTEEGLVAFLEALLSVFSSDAPLAMDTSALHALRKAGGTYRVRRFVCDGMDLRSLIPHLGGGATMALIGVAKGISVDAMRKYSLPLLEGGKGCHIGFYDPAVPDGPLQGFIIDRAPTESLDRPDQPLKSLPDGSLDLGDPTLGSSRLLGGIDGPIHR